jgi:hypothetical protein
MPADTFAHASVEEALRSQFPYAPDLVVPSLLLRLALEGKIHFKQGVDYGDDSGLPNLYIRRGVVTPADNFEQRLIDYTTALPHWWYTPSDPNWKRVRAEIEGRSQAMYRIAPKWIKRLCLIVSFAIWFLALMHLPDVPEGSQNLLQIPLGSALIAAFWYGLFIISLLGILHGWLLRGMTSVLRSKQGAAVRLNMTILKKRIKDRDIAKNPPAPLCVILPYGLWFDGRADLISSILARPSRCRSALLRACGTEAQQAVGDVLRGLIQPIELAGLHRAAMN